MRRATLALGAILSACAGAAAAQQAPQVPNVTPDRDWLVDGRLVTAYDSNVARGNAATAAARGVSRDDVTVTPTVHMRVVQPIGQQVVFLDGLAGYDFHTNNPQLDRHRYAVSAGASGQIGICRPSLFGNYRALQSDLADLSLQATRNLQRVESIGAAIGCSRNVGPMANVAVQRTNVFNSADVVKANDYTAETLSASVGYVAPTLVNVFLAYTYSSNEFPNRIIPGRPVGDGFFVESLGLRLDRKFGSRLQVSGGVGVARVKREFAPAGTPSKFTSTNYDATVGYSFGRRIQLNLTGSRNVRPSDRPGKLFDIAEALEGAVTYRLSPRIAISVGHSYTDTNSNVDTLLAGLVVTNSITNSTFARVNLQKIGPGTVSLDVRHDRRNTNVPSFDYSANRIALTTAVSF